MLPTIPTAVAVPKLGSRVKAVSDDGDVPGSCNGPPPY